MYFLTAHVLRRPHLVAIVLIAGLFYLNPTAVRAEGIMIPAGSRVDMVYDPVRDVVYISNAGQILRFHMGTETFLTPLQLGGSLKGMDLSDDGNTLAVADGERTDIDAWIHLVDLNTEQSRRVSFTRSNTGEGGTYTVAFAGDGSLFITSSYEGSGWVPMRRYDFTTETMTTLASVRQDTMLTASADGNTIAFAESNSSDGPWGTYDIATETLNRRQGYTNGTSAFNYEIGVNHNGTQFAVPTYSGTYIYETTFSQMNTVGQPAGLQPIGVAYHPTQDLVYFAWAGTTKVRAHDTTSFETMATYDVGYTFTAPGNRAFQHGRVKISRDGIYLMVTVGGGVRVVQIAEKPPVPALTVQPPQAIPPGEVVYIPVYLNDVDVVHKLSGIQFSLNVTDTQILSPEPTAPPIMGDLFATDTITAITPTATGWEFLLTTSLSATDPYSGTGLLVSLPFTTKAVGCAGLEFSEHKLSNSDAQALVHTATGSTVCAIDEGTVAGQLALDWRASGHYTDTQVTLVGSQATYTTTTAPDGSFIFNTVYSGTYTLSARHALYVDAVRTVTVERGASTTVPPLGLWAGDVDQDQDVDKRDWFIFSAAIHPIGDPTFDLNDDGETDIYDLVMVHGNIGQTEMGSTNPPSRTGTGLRRESAPSKSSGGELTLALQNGQLALNLTKLTLPVCAIGVRLAVPNSAAIENFTVNASLTTGFAHAHHAANQYYLVIAPTEGQVLSNAGNVALLEGINLQRVTLDAVNLVSCAKSIYLPAIFN